MLAKPKEPVPADMLKAMVEVCSKEVKVLRVGKWTSVHSVGGRVQLFDGQA